MPEIEKPVGSRWRLQHFRNGSKGIGRRRLIVGHGVGKNDGMRFSMRKIEAPAKHVAQLVVKGHSDATEAYAAQPSTIESGRSRIAICRVFDNNRKRASERRDPILC